MNTKIKQNQRLPPEVNRIIFVRNLPFKISSDELYDIFGKFGTIRQMRKGNTSKTKGTCFIVYEDIFKAKQAVDHLNGFNVAGKYLICLYYQQNKAGQKRGENQQKVN
mmetsp:Transcript_31224/g.38570  ORF Transcript_31224/g.38570 Transcript_31224/m.38570 type:complete len:108 (+) Transcript_31224:20-343(+)